MNMCFRINLKNMNKSFEANICVTNSFQLVNYLSMKYMNVNVFSFQIFIITPVASYPKFQCPTRTEWKFRAAGKCNISGGYYCLFNENIDSYTELCDKKSYNWQSGLYVMAYI